MEDILNQILQFCITAGGRLLGAAAVFLIGSFLIRRILKIVQNASFFGKLDETFKSVIFKAFRIALYLLLIVIIISVLGVPIASVVAVIASAGVAVGLALQGALSNLAGGIMLVLFRPFVLGDFVSTAGGDGTVQDIGIFYTTLTTVDNRTILIPNGTLMNSTVINVSREPLRRLDLSFTCDRSQNISVVEKILLEAALSEEAVIRQMDGKEPYAHVTGTSENALVFSLRVWCKKEDYWPLNQALLLSVTTKMQEMGVQRPRAKVIYDKEEQDQ